MAEPKNKLEDTSFSETGNKGFNKQTGTTGSEFGTTGANRDTSTTGSTQSQTGGAAAGLDKDAVKDVYNKAKETTKEKAKEAYSQVAEKATTQIEEQKTNLAHGLTSIADSVRQFSGNLREADEETPIAAFTAKYGETLAQQVEGVSSYLEEKDLNEMVRDVESYARRNPAIFIGAALATGFLLARFLRSSGSSSTTTQRSLKSGKKNALPKSTGSKTDLTANTGGTSGTSSTTSGTSGTSDPKSKTSQTF